MCDRHEFLPWLDATILSLFQSQGSAGGLFDLRHFDQEVFRAFDVELYVLLFLNMKLLAQSLQYLRSVTPSEEGEPWKKCTYN